MDNAPHPEEYDPDEKPLPWEDRTRVYRAIHTKSGRNVQICFVPNTGTHDRYLPLADLRLADASKDGHEILLEFSAVKVVVTGRFLRRAADTIMSGRCIALEAFDGQRRDVPSEPTNPYIERIQFLVPVRKPEAGDEAPHGRPSAKRPRAVA